MQFGFGMRLFDLWNLGDLRTFGVWCSVFGAWRVLPDACLMVHGSRIKAHDYDLAMA